MPKNITWGDAFARLVVPDVISYKLPETKRLDDAPSHLVIDGFGTLEMQRTRVSVYNNEALNIIDSTRRHPLHATMTRGRTPESAHMPQLVAAGPTVGIGPGRPERDTGLYSEGKMAAFAGFACAALLGAAALTTTLWALPCVLFGLGGMLWVLINPTYHVVDGQLPAQPPVAVAEPAAARARQARVA